MHDEYPFTIHEGYCHKKTLMHLSWFKNVNSNNFSLEWKFLFVDHRAPPIIGKICRTVLIDARKYTKTFFLHVRAIFDDCWITLLFFVEWNVGVLLYIRKTNISVLEKRNSSSTFSMISRTVFLRALIRKTIKHTKRETYCEPPRLPHLRAARHIWVGIIQLCPLVVLIFGILPS